MSICISRHGEYSSHTLDDLHICTRCSAVDEDALRADLAQLRQLVRSVDLYGMGYIYQPPGKDKIVLDPREVTVVIPAGQKTPAEARIAELEVKLAEATLRLAEYDNSINWDTNCLNCSALLDRCYAAERLVDAVRQWRVQWDKPGRYISPVAELVVNAYDDLAAAEQTTALIDASSLGTGDAAALRASVPDEIAARIAARSKQIAADSSSQASAADSGETGPDVEAWLPDLPLKMCASCRRTAMLIEAMRTVYRCPECHAADEIVIKPSDDADPREVPINTQTWDRARLEREFAEMTAYVQTINGRIVKAIGILDDSWVGRDDPEPLVRSLYAVLEPGSWVGRDRADSRAGQAGQEVAG